MIKARNKYKYRHFAISRRFSRHLYWKSISDWKTSITHLYLGLCKNIGIWKKLPFGINYICSSLISAEVGSFCKKLIFCWENTTEKEHHVYLMIFCMCSDAILCKDDTSYLWRSHKILNCNKMLIYVVQHKTCFTQEIT